MTRTALVAPGALQDFLRSRTTGPAAKDDLRPLRDHDDLLPLRDHDDLLPLRDHDDLHDEDLDADLAERLQEMYVSALPGRLADITRSTRAGDAPALASAASTLAGTSGQLGHPEVASVCQAIARDARRGILAHTRLAELQALIRD